MRYNNYHKHTHYSSIFTPDSCCKIDEYIKRIIELNHTTYFTTEHGWGGDIFEAKELCNKYNVKCVYGLEGYIVNNPLEKDKSNYHIVIIPKTNIARKKLNKINTRANKDGFYYRPRIFLEDLLKCDKDDFFITTACLKGLLNNKESFNDIFMPLFKHYQENIFLEIQSHNSDKQKEINKRALSLSKKYNIKLIHANDSHYILPKDKIKNKILLLGKKIEYDDENDFILDFPSYNEILERYKIQDVLDNETIKIAINNTLLLDSCEEIDINKNIKMPNIYKELNVDERIDKLKNIINERFKEIIYKDNIGKKDLPLYKKAILEEFKVITDTKEINVMDYFLLNEKMIDLATNKYKGVLTTSSRGSAGAFYLNRILGITQIDRVKADIPIYYERFMDTVRLLENHSLPDVDFNVSNPEPFIQASKELLGENGCRWMIAYGTMQDAEAFRNYCRAKDMNFDEYNEIAKNLLEYENNPKWKDIINESKEFIGTIISASQHPCSNLLFDGDLEEELGCIKIGDIMCCPITSSEADDWKYLKNDYLTVSTVDLVSKTFNLIGIPRMSIAELTSKLDNKTWEIYEKGLTCTVNQVDSDWATKLMQQYKCKTIGELAMFVAAIRPSFETYRDKFLNRESNNSGIEKLDNLFEKTNQYILFQENLMQFFEWLGISPSKSISLIKKISKKKIKQDDFDNLENTLKENWIKENGNDMGFKTTWELLQSQISYGFNAPHALAMAYDSLYSAYLKSHYSLEYYATVLEMYQRDKDRTRKLTKELEYFNIKLSNIKYGKSKGEYFIDKENNIIYKGIGSLKTFSTTIGDRLYELSLNKDIDNFYDLLNNLQRIVNQTQIEILIKLDYFSNFGKNKKLLDFYKLFKEFNNKSQIKKINKEYSISLETLSNYCEIRETIYNRYSSIISCEDDYKNYKNFNYKNFLKDQWDLLENKDLPIYNKLEIELEYLGYIDYVNDKFIDYYYIIESKKNSSGTKTLIKAYNLSNGETRNLVVKDKNKLSLYPLNVGNIFQLLRESEDYKYIIDPSGKTIKDKKTGKEKPNFIKSNTIETLLVDWLTIKNEISKEVKY